MIIAAEFVLEELHFPQSLNLAALYGALAHVSVDNVVVFLNIKQGRGWGYYSDWNMTYLT